MNNVQETGSLTGSLNTDSRAPVPAPARLTRAEDAFFKLLDRSLPTVRMRFLLPGGSVEVGGAGSGSPDFVVRVSDRRFASRVLAKGNLGLGESYMDEGWWLEKGSLEDLLTVFACARMDEKLREMPSVFLRVAGMRLLHAFTGARRNVRLHYDAGNDLYELFLDETMAYSCGYQKTPEDSLRQLQENKFERICQKIRLAPGDTLLDIGCGWGGLVIYAAEKFAVKAHGITIAENQAAFARERVRKLGLQDRVTIQCGDYKEAKGQYSKVVSVGMFEHLYSHEHATYFDHVRDRLQADGWGLVHFMSCVGPRNEPDPFVQKYIYPGSTHPHLSSAIRHLERNDLAVLDVENIARHYLPTSRYWLENFRANRHKADPQRYDERFLRMYEYLLCLYIAGCAAPVSALFHVLFTKDFRGNVPMYRV